MLTPWWKISQNHNVNTPAKYIGRFAPSPTGPLHFGSLVAALASYLDAKAHGGTWRVRIEDVDETRCKPVHAEDILRTLTAFGLVWDGDVMVQSRRKSAYEQALARLSKASRIYACTCSRKEIADSAMGIEGPIYPGTCRACSREGARAATLVDNIAAVRVLTTDEPIQFHDRVQGTIIQHIESEIGDFVVKRRDGLFAYQLAVVVDDAEQDVTHVVRGADLLDSTARQIYLQKLLGFTTPQYLHVPIVINENGQKLSKQTLARSLGHTDVVATLQAALAFLGQQRVPAILSAAALLASAVRQWRETDIPSTATRK
jgi:glutamyl-Q tRNA(Asp) synthetase